MLRIWSNAPSLNQKYYLKYLSEDLYPYDEFQDGEIRKVEQSLDFESVLPVDVINNIPVQPSYIGLPIIKISLLTEIKKLILVESQEVPIVINCIDGKSESFVLLNILKTANLVDINNSNVSYYSKKMGGRVRDIKNYHTLDSEMPMTAFVRELDYLPVVYVHPIVSGFLIKKNLNYTTLPYVNDYFD